MCNFDSLRLTFTPSQAAFEQAKADDEAAVDLLGQAIAALSSYFENNIEGGVGDLQGNVKALLQQVTLEHRLVLVESLTSILLFELLLHCVDALGTR